MLPTFSGACMNQYHVYSVSNDETIKTRQRDNDTSLLYYIIL